MLDWIYPKMVGTVNSPINGPIKILKSRGEYSVWINKFEQSGGFYVQKIWKDALKRISLDVTSCLILGLGCGTVAKIVANKWPKAKIVGVEIDPVMINLGKKYFGLSQISRLTIINQDAKQFVKSAKEKFDLILLDAYIGNEKKNIAIPKKLFKKNGVVVTNNLIGLASKLVVKSINV